MTIRKLLCSAFLLLVLTGCATTGKEIPATSVEQMQKGKTTKEEVLKMFGQPDNTYFDKEGKLIYSYFSSKMRSSAWNFIPIVNLVHSETQMKTQMLTILFAKDGTVEEYSFTNSDKPTKYGLIP